MSTGFRWRTTFRKTGRLRFLSHLEVARALERSVRRADLPFAITQGFSPHMRIAFGPALPVGCAGEAELFDVWLRAFVPAADALARLTASAPEDLAPTAGRYVSDTRPSLSAGAVAARYRVVVAGGPGRAAELEAAMARVAALDSLDVAHKQKVRTFSPRQELLETVVVASEGRDVVLYLTLRLGAQGALRPDALVEAALEYSGTGTSGMVVTRLALLEDRDGELVEPLW